jgi:hypothetical protein
MPRPFSGVEPSTEVESASWWVDRLHPFARDVGSVVPDGFAAYARVEHTTADDGSGSWEGGLARPVLQALLPHLEQATSTPGTCWFGLWDGYGSVARGAGGSPDEPGAVAWMRWRWHQWRAPSNPTYYLVSDATGWRRWALLRLARWRLGVRARRWNRRIHMVTRRCGVVDAPDREYLLWSGPVAAAAASSVPPDWPLFAEDWDAVELSGPLDGPNVWWPADRAWFVASEIDLAWTYVGGPQALIDAIVGDQRCPTEPTTPTDPIVPVG